MKHLKPYRLFEGEEIDDRLEFEVGDEVWVNSYNGYEWKDIPCQVMDIKVGTDVAGSPHNEIRVYFYYVRNSETEEIRPFRSFKLLKIENDINESTAYDDMKNIIEDASSICDDIRDEGFKIDVKPDSDIHIKMLGMYRKGTISSPPTNKIEITISKNVFYFVDIQETIGRLVGYMEDENFTCDVDFVTEVADRAARVSMRRPISRKLKYKEFVKLFGDDRLYDIDDKRSSNLFIMDNKLSSIKLIFEIDSLYLLDVINQRDK